MILKLCVIATVVLGLAIMFKVLRIEEMLRHTQNCLALGADGLAWPTHKEANKARERTNKCS